MGMAAKGSETSNPNQKVGGGVNPKKSIPPKIPKLALAFFSLFSLNVKIAYSP